jgi:hypothetical protein
MRNVRFLALAVALVLGWAIQDAHARPGGGGRRGGGANVGGTRGGNFAPGGKIGQQGAGNLDNKLQGTIKNGNVAGNLQNGNLQNGNVQNKVSQLKTNFTAGNQPFTASWYANHPRAWQYTHPHADAWAVAGYGRAAAWLGLAAVTNDAYVIDDVTTGDTDDADQGEFLPLGVFALAPQNERDANALVQLAVNKQGEVAGNYYDVLTGQDQTIAGKVDKQSKQVTFAVSPGGNVSFETSLANLTQARGSITLRFANGQSRQWTLARFDDAVAQKN